MTNLLIYLRMPEEVRIKYGQALAPKFPELGIRTVSTQDEAAQHAHDADILLTFGAMMRDDTFENAERLKWVHALGTGVDGIIDSPSLGKDVVVSSTRGIHGPAMSEHTLLLMLALSRDLPRSLKLQDECQWVRWPGRLLDEKTVGILGVGLIAEDLAPKCKALGMTVVGISRTPRDVPGIDRFADRDRLVEAVPEFDHLVVLVPYEPETANIVDAEVFAAMKPTSYLINVARGGVVDENALIDALENSQIAGAGLDTFLTEPLPPDHPLWKAKNTIITPHLGGFNDTYVEKALPIFEKNLRHFLAGEYDQMMYREER